VEAFHLFQILVITPNAALQLHLVGGAHIMLELSSNNLQMVVQWNNMPSSTHASALSQHLVCVCCVCPAQTVHYFSSHHSFSLRIWNQRWWNT